MKATDVSECTVQFCVQCMNPALNILTSFLHRPLTSYCDPLGCALAGIVGIKNSDYVLFSLSDWTHVLAVHAGKPELLIDSVLLV